jgi:hypothetical protein
MIELLKSIVIAISKGARKCQCEGCNRARKCQDGISHARIIPDESQKNEI